MAKLVEVRHRLVLALVSLLLVCLLSACGATAGPKASAQHAKTKPKHCRRGAHPVGSSRLAVAAVVLKRATAYRRPGRKPFASFGHLNQDDFPTVFRVVSAIRRSDCTPAWYRVQLPIKPNGVTGYVRAKAVETGRVHSRVVVEIGRAHV